MQNPSIQQDLSIQDSTIGYALQHGGNIDKKGDESIEQTLLYIGQPGISAKSLNLGKSLKSSWAKA